MLNDAVVTIGQFSVAMPLTVGLARVGVISTPARWLVGLLALWLAAEVVAYATRMAGFENMWISYFLTVGELLIGYRVFKALLPEMPVRSIVIAGLVITLVEYLVGGPWNSVSLLYESAMFLVLGLFLFREMAEGRVSWGYSWTMAGLMVLFIGSSVYYSSYLHPDDTALLRLLSNAHTVLLFVVYGMLTVGMWKLS